MNEHAMSPMSEFFDESVQGNIKPLVTSNKAFTIEENNKPLYIGMLLDTQKIGGITKKSKNNQHIGGLIECIKGGRIDVYVTAESNQKGELLFIPTPSTFAALEDYGLFRNFRQYEFVKLNNNLEIVERTGVFASYDDFRSIAGGQKTVNDFLSSQANATAFASETNTVSESVIEDEEDVVVEPETSTSTANTASQIVDKAKTVAATVKDKAVAIVDKVADSVGYKDMVGKKDESSAVTSVSSPVTAPTESAVNKQVVEEEQDVVYTETQIIGSIERMFHADNLDLPVSSEPFDQLFTLNNHLIKFDVDSRDTYVNERLNIMAVDANRDLQKLRSDNLRRLREKYFMLLSVRVLEIQKELDINNQSSEYGSQKWAIENTKKEKLDNVSGLVDERRKALEAEFNRRRDEYCDNVAKTARNDYNNHHLRAHNEEINRVEGIIKAEIEADYNRDLNALYVARRNEALTLLDLNITGILKELIDEYKIMFEEENALYSKRADEMRAYAKELHEEDAKRLAIEEEKNRVSNEVSAARADAAAQIELIKTEYENAQVMLEARSQATVAQAQNTADLLKKQLEARELAFEQDKARLQKQLDDAIDRADKAHEVTRLDYEHRLEQAKDDVESWKQAKLSADDQHKHTNRVTAVVVIAITIAALLGGFMLGGMFWNRFVTGDWLANNTSQPAINIIETNDASDVVADVVTDESVITDAAAENVIATTSATSFENIFTEPIVVGVTNVDDADISDEQTTPAAPSVTEETVQSVTSETEDDSVVSDVA